MKRKFLVLLGSVLAVTLCWSAAAHAFNGHAGQEVDIAKDEVLDSSFYAAGKHLTISGTVKGDVYCAGQSVDISGTVEGDVLCAAQTVRISGTVMGDVRLIGQTVEVAGAVQGSASLVAQVATMEKDAKIGRDTSLVAQTVRLGGEIGRDVASTADSLTISGSVGREVRALGSTTMLRGTAKVGSLTYTSTKDAVIENGAQVLGKTDHQYPKPKAKPQVSPLRRLIAPIYGLLSMLLVGVLFLLLAPRWFAGTITLMQEKPGGTVGLGLGVLFATPVVAGLICFTIIGIPLGVGLFLLWLGVCGLAFLFSSYSLGTMVVARIEQLQRWADVAPLLIGTLLFGLLTLIPVINIFVIVGGLLWGIGGISWGIARAIAHQRSPLKPIKKRTGPTVL